MPASATETQLAVNALGCSLVSFEVDIGLTYSRSCSSMAENAAGVVSAGGDTYGGVDGGQIHKFLQRCLPGMIMQLSPATVHGKAANNPRVRRLVVLKGR